MEENQIKNIISKLNFKCQKCSNCCRLEPGAVFLTEEDTLKIYKFLNMDMIPFILQYCRGIRKFDDEIVALKEKINYDCIFWDNGCQIYPVRPLQCRAFPFWPYLVESESSWKKEKYRCKGIDIKGRISFEDKFNLYNLEKNTKHMKMPALPW